MDKFMVHKKGELVYYTVPSFDEQNVRHLYTTKLGGVSKNQYCSLNFSLKEDESEQNVLQNYKITLDAIGADINSLVCTKQVHGNTITVVDKADCGRGITKPEDWETDALITATEGVSLVAYYADCACLAFYDKKNRAIGVAHAGWRGAVGGIAGKTIEKMNEQFGSKPSDILVSIGPCIGKECFQIGEEVIAQAKNAYGSDAQPFIYSNANGNYLDLAGLNDLNLTLLGVPKQNITMANLCTYCNCDEFWSHRKTNGIRGKHGVFITI